MKHVETTFLVNSLKIKLSSFFLGCSVLSFFLPRNVVLVSVPSLLDPDFAPKVGAGSAQRGDRCDRFSRISCIWIWDHCHVPNVSKVSKCMPLTWRKHAKAVGQHHPIHLDACTNSMTHWPCAGHCLSAHVFFGAVRLCPTVPKKN